MWGVGRRDVSARGGDGCRGNAGVDGPASDAVKGRSTSMTTLARDSATLTRNAFTVLQPGFTGTSAPDWLLRRLGEGLAPVGLFGRNIASPEQLAALTPPLRPG